MVFYENQELKLTQSGAIRDKVGGVKFFGMLLLYGDEVEPIKTNIDYLRKRPTYKDRRYEAASKKLAKCVSISDISEKLTVMRFCGDNLQEMYELLHQILFDVGDNILKGLRPYSDRVDLEGKNVDKK